MLNIRWHSAVGFRFFVFSFLCFFVSTHSCLSSALCQLFPFSPLGRDAGFYAKLEGRWSTLILSSSLAFC
jgi:hypothetical protein